MQGMRRTIEAKWRANRARWSILLIGAVAIGGIGCMMLTVIIILVTR